jgi:hypothetical protein
MSPERFEPAIPAGKRSQIDPLDRAANEIVFLCSVSNDIALSALRHMNKFGDSMEYTALSAAPDP